MISYTDFNMLSVQVGKTEMEHKAYALNLTIKPRNKHMLPGLNIASGGFELVATHTWEAPGILKDIIEAKKCLKKT